MSELVLAHTDSLSSIKFHDKFLETLNNKFQEMRCENKEQDTRLRQADFDFKEVKGEVTKVKKDIQEVMKDSKSKNIIISGLKEGKGENCLQAVVAFLKGIVPTINGDHIEMCYRIGTDTGGTSPVQVKFKDSTVKQQIMKKKSVLKDQKKTACVFCNDGLHDTSRKTDKQCASLPNLPVKKATNMQSV